MADTFLWDEDSLNPTGDVENPPVSIANDGQEANTDSGISKSTHATNFCSTSKAAKLGLGLLASAGVVAIGVVLGLNGSKDDPVPMQAASSASSIVKEADQGFVESNTKSINDSYITSPSSLEARVKMASSSSAKGFYDTCDDLEKDIIEALKLYMVDYIANEAVINEAYASCDPDNENWWWDLFWYDDDYYYHGSQNVDYICDPATNSIDSCIIEEKDVPWVLTWHEWDHAEGKLFYDEDEALEAYENVNASFAKRLYDPSKMQVDEYGSMGGFEWCELETWAYGAQCNGEAPAASSTEQTARSNNPGPRGIEKQKRSYAPRNHQAYPKQTRSGIPPGLKKQARSNIPIPSDRHDNSKQGKHRNKKSGDTPDSFSQNSQNKDVDEMDKVVSDGSFIYAAYGDVLYALPTDGEMKEASITLMPGEAKECDWNTTEPCTTVTKPNIEALFLGKDNSRLTVVVSSNIYEYLTPTDQNPPLITDYGTQLEVRVYDVSEVTPGSPLNELGHKALSGSLFDGVSVGDKIVIATSSLLDTYELTKGISRSELQYCGLNTTSYKEVATSTAESKIDLLASQIVDELDLLNECSKIVPLSMMMDASDPDDVDVPGLTGVDFLQGSFIQIFSLDVSSDFDADEAIQSSVAGSFRAGWGYSFYLSDGFLALLSDIYKFNYTTGESTYESFILGFDISSEKDVAPVYYGHLPGLMGGKYRMEKSGDHLKILSTETYSVDPEIWSPNYLTKIFTLGIPSTPGRMPLLDKSEDLLDKKYETTAITFSGDKIYLVADDWNYENKKRFVVVDMVDQMNPNVVSSLEIDSFVSYLHEININGSPYILCVGTFTNTSTWESSTALTLIDVSTPLDPKKAAFYKEEPGVYSGIYDFLAVRYLEDSNKLILPFSSTNYTDHPATFTVGFQVYDISASAISSAFNVVHSTNEHYCYYEAMLPPRSFVIQSELITFKEHSAVKSNVDTGSFISKLDLDVGFNYSVCDEWYYYDYAYSYEYIDDDAINSTEV